MKDYWSMKNTTAVSTREGRDHWKDLFFDLYEPLPEIAKKTRLFVEVIKSRGYDFKRRTYTGLELCDSFLSRYDYAHFSKYNYASFSEYDSEPESLPDDDIEGLSTLLEKKANEGKIMLSTSPYWVFDRPSFYARDSASLIYQVTESGIALILKTPHVEQHERLHKPSRRFMVTHETTTDKLHMKLGLIRDATENPEILEELRKEVCI